MTWAFIVSLTLFALAKVIVTCLPTGVVEWILKKFELHPTLSDETVTVTIDGKQLVGEDKKQIVHYFNEALFLEKYYANPENSGTPLIIDMNKGKNNVKLCLYNYNDHIDVVKTYKKKVVTYRLRSDSLQNHALLAN